MILCGCSSSVPLQIKNPPEENPDIVRVQSNPDCCVGQTVRWGGKILATQNLARSTRITVLARPLTKNGRPKDVESSPGRFIAEFPQFLDPALYPNERKLTVVGQYTGQETITIGEFPYKQPVVEVEQHYLWPDDSDDPYLYYPWYPWHSFPYYYPYPYHFYRY